MTCILNRKEIASILPQQKEFLFPQTFESVNCGGALYGKGTMKIRQNNFYLKRHFGCIPGTIIIEFAEQVATLLIMTEMDIDGDPVVCKLENPGPIFGKVKTVAGDKLLCKVTLTKQKSGIYFFESHIFNQHEITILKTGITGTSTPKNTLAIAVEAENVKT